MVMAVKQQILLSRNPKDLVFVTLNHLDAIHDYVRNPQAKANLEMTHELLVQGHNSIDKSLWVFLAQAFTVTPVRGTDCFL